MKGVSTIPGLFAVIVLIGLLSHSQVLAQGGPGASGWGRGGAFNRLYNPQTVVTISGEVQTVEQVSPLRGMGQGIHLLVKTEQGTNSVHLGPAWFVENQEIRIEPKDQVEVTGSQVSIQGHPAIIASQIRKGDEVLRLRDANGVPVWAGWRRNSGAGAGAGQGGMMTGGTNSPDAKTPGP